jgi:Icc protein
MNHFVQISDCHIDDAQALGVNTDVNLAKIIDKITMIKSEMLIISGDLTHNGTKKSYQKLQKILSPIETDIFVIAGNHDNLDNFSPEFKMLEKCTLGTWDILSINSVQTGKTSGLATTETLSKLDAQLSQSKANHIIIILHHPIVPMNSTWDDALSLENPQDLLTLLSKHPKVRAVLFGHAHEAAEFSKNGLKIIACPSTAVQFTNEKRIGFNYYTLFNNGRLDYETRWMNS